MSYAKGSYNSIYGKIESGWKIVDNKIILEVTIPSNVQAKIIFGDVNNVYPSGKYVFEKEI